MMNIIKFKKPSKNWGKLANSIFLSGNKELFVPFKEYCLAKQNIELWLKS